MKLDRQSIKGIIKMWRRIQFWGDPKSFRVQLKAKGAKESAYLDSGQTAQPLIIRW